MYNAILEKGIRVDREKKTIVKQVDKKKINWKNILCRAPNILKNPASWMVKFECCTPSSEESSGSCA